MPFVAVILICKAVSFGAMADGAPQCAYNAPGMVSAYRVPGTIPTIEKCHLKASAIVRRYTADLQEKSEVATWQCMTQDEATNSGL